MSRPDAASPSIQTAPTLSWGIGAVLTTLSLLLLLPLLVFLLWSVRDEANRIQSRTESVAMSLAQISAHTLERKLSDTQHFLATMSARANVRALDSARCDPVFGDFQKSHPGFTVLTTSTQDGQLICGVVGAAADRPRLSAPLTSGPASGAPQFQLGHAQKGAISGRWVMPISLPLLDDSGAPRGAIAAWIDLTRLSPLNESALNRMPKDTVSTVFDDDGVILARSRDANKMVGENRSGFPQATQALQQRQGFFQTTSQTDGIHRLYAVVPVEGTRWIVSMGIPTTAMDAELALARQQNFALFGGAVLFTGLMLWLVRRYTVRPIQIGAAVTQAVKDGDLQRRIPLESVGHLSELKSIAIGFNAMLDTLVDERVRLTQSEADFRTLFTEMRSGFAVHELIFDTAGVAVDYRFLAVNPAFEAMTGLRASTLIGKRVLEVLTTLEPIWIERYGRVTLTGEPAAFEDYSAELKKYFDVRAFRIRPGQFAVMTLDITDRRLAENALARERALLRRVMDSIPDLIFFKDINGHYLGCNKAFEAFAGRDEQAQVGRTDFDFFDAKTASFFREQDQKMLQSGEARQNEEWVTYPDSRQVLLQTIKTPFSIMQGESIGILGISRDITAQHLAQIEIKASNQTYQAILATALDGFWIADLQGQLHEVNDAYIAMSGFSREELLQKHVSDLDIQDPPDVARRRLERIKLIGSDLFETRHRRKSGELWDAEVSTNYWAEQDRLFIFIRDISARKQAEGQLQQAAAVFENTQEGMMVTDTQDIIVRINPAFTILTGFSAEDAIGKTPSILNSPQQDASLFVMMRKSLARSGQWKGEIINRRKDGTDFSQWMTISSILDSAGEVSHYVSTFTDISQLKDAQAKIHNLAFFDPLTQLPNRRLMLDRLHRSVALCARRKSCGAVLLIDLDNFKLINDTEGHEVGDMLLVEVARRLKSCVREQDSLAHQGGDEFIVILEDLGHELHEAASRAELVAEKIMQSLRESYQLGLLEHHSQASIGVATFQDPTDNAEEILKRADTAMYRAKAEGRNTVRFFDPAMQAALQQRIKLETELRHALPGNELQLYYQAQVDGDGKVLSAEVLIRWQHPQRGLVSPVQFIPLAEESGLILPIGAWVLETACAQLKAWENHPLARDLKLAVNVSARQFRQDDFVSITKHVVDQSGIDPTRLKLELTESIVINNVADTIEKMHQLKVLGLTFSMDDFGTGYSSLAYLKRLPLDQLKIDQSFVRDISHDPSDAAIVQTIITMGNTLGLNVIAEGVETQVQLDFLQKHGCKTFQGYLFSRPVPLAEFEKLLIA